MELLGKIVLIIHIIAGASTLITGPIAIFYNFKDPRKHRLVGKVFFYAMLIVGFSSVGGYLKHPHDPFRQFLMGIAILVLAGVVKGVRTIFLMKGGPILRFDFFYTAFLGLGGFWMLGLGIWHFQQGTMIAIPILFSVFSLMALRDTWENWHLFRSPGKVHRLEWMRIHARTMIGAFIASTTAFTVNAAHGLPWWAQWFGPTLLLLPVQIYFGRKIKDLKIKAQVNPARPEPSVI